MKWFKLDEFRCHCCGKIASIENTVALVENVLDPAREKLGHGVVVTSGTRCEKHNAECRGASKTSQHMRSEAADIVPVEILGRARDEELKRLARIIVENGKWDQMILYPTFVHVSWKRDGVNRKQILRKTPGGYQKVEPSCI